MNGSLVKMPWPRIEDCDPGLRVLEYKVLVLMPVVSDKTSGGIRITDVVRDQESLAATAGMIVSISPMAFKFADWPRDEAGAYVHPDMIPKPGDIVRIKQYAGGQWRGRDGHNYRIIDDRDVHGIEDQSEPAEQPEAKEKAA